MFPVTEGAKSCWDERGPGNCGSEANKNASQRHESVPGEEEPLQTTGIVKESKNGEHSSTSS